MIEIKIPKDISKYEAKLIGPFSTRQTICAAVAAGLCVLVYNVLKPISDVNIASAACFVVAVPAVLMGWYKPYGMPFEKFFKNVFLTLFLAPTRRKYQIKNGYEIFETIATNEENKNNPHAKKSKKKYKKSKKAFK